MLSHCVCYPSLSFFVTSPPRLRSVGAGVRPAAEQPCFPSYDSSESLVAVDYLINCCNLPRSKALKAAKYLPKNFKSTLKPDAVLAFLRGAGLSDANIAEVVAFDPNILSVNVYTNLVPKAAELAEIGFSSAQITELLVVTPCGFRSSRLIEKVKFIINFFGSKETVLRAVKRNRILLASNFDNSVVPNLALLQECGLGVRQIAVLLRESWLLTQRPDAVRDVIDRVDKLGVPRGSSVYVQALWVVNNMAKASFNDKLSFIRQLGWSDTDVLDMIRCRPNLLLLSEQNLQRKAKFLVETVGLDWTYIAERSILLTLSLEKRLIPRFNVMKALWDMGLSKCKFYSAALLSEGKFMDKFVLRYEGRIPGLFDIYAEATLRNEIDA